MGRRLRILLADDNEQMLQAVDDLLRSEFDVVGQVKDGRAMVRAAQEQLPDLIVADLEMPELDGIQAAKLLGRLEPSVAVIILTIHGARELIEEAFHSGASGYVIKADAGDELIQAIHEVAAGRKFLSHSCQV